MSRYEVGWRQPGTMQLVHLVVVAGDWNHAAQLATHMRKAMAEDEGTVAVAEPDVIRRLT